MTAPVPAAGPPRRVRRFVAVLLVLLAVPGVIGFEVWPMSGWRLFSLARDDDQTRWQVDAVLAGGETSTVDLDELPIAFRNAEWPLSGLPGAGEERRDDVCHALLDGVRGRLPTAVGLRIVRDHQTLREVDGEWVVDHRRESFHTCGDARDDGS